MLRYVWVLLLLVSACKGRDQVTPPVPAPTPLASPSATQTASVPPDTTSYMATMFTRLGTERDSRPDGTPKVEAVMAALTADGLPMQPGRQVLAAIVKASYCWQTATTDAKLGVAICEYPSAEAAVAGKEQARVQGAAFGERVIVVNGKTTLLMKGPEAQVAKATKVFAGMKP